MNFNFDKELLRNNNNRLLPGLISLAKPVQKRGQIEEAMKLYNFTDVQDFKDFLEPEIYIPKMNPEFIPAYIKMIKLRDKLHEPSPYPVYIRTIPTRLWYRYSWTFTIIMVIVANYNGYRTLKEIK